MIQTQRSGWNALENAKPSTSVSHMANTGGTLDYADASIPARNPDKAIETILIVIFLLVATVFSVIPVTNQIHKMRQHEDGTKDYPLWFDTGFRERHGVSPYFTDRNGEFPFMYPPGAAAVLAPLTMFGKLPLVIFLVLLNSVAWATAILAPIYLITGRIRSAPHSMYWLPSLICVVFIWDTYLEGQLAFCLSACLLGMLVCLQLKKQKTAAFLLALAAGFKAFPILALPYLIYRRHWKALCYTVLFLMLMVVVLPAVFRGPHGAIQDLRTWFHGMLSPDTPERMGESARAVRSYTWQNGSLKAVLHRWLRPVVADSDDNLPKLYVNIASMPFKTINQIATALTLLLGLGYVLVMPRRKNRTRFTDAAEGAMLLILVILVCPLSFNYNNAWLMCGIAVVIYFITQTPKKQSTIALIWLAVALLPLIFGLRPKDPNWRYLRAIGNTFFADLLLLLELAWLIVRMNRKRLSPNDPFSRA
jgi:hypothetical protein